MKEENLIQLIDAIIDDHVIGSNESGSLSTESNNKKSMVIKDAEKNLKKLHEKVILHSHIFKENLAAVQLILSGLEDIKHELEEIKHGKKHP